MEHHRMKGPIIVQIKVMFMADGKAHLIDMPIDIGKLPDLGDLLAFYYAAAEKVKAETGAKEVWLPNAREFAEVVAKGKGVSWPLAVDPVWWQDRRVEPEGESSETEDAEVAGGKVSDLVRRLHPHGQHSGVPGDAIAGE